MKLTLRTPAIATLLFLTATTGLLAHAPAAAGGSDVPCLDELTVAHVCTEGELSDGTPYRFVRPEHWNRTVLVGLDFAADETADPVTRELTRRGYAVGGTTRTVTGWDIAAAIDNQAEALAAFERANGSPRRAIASGRSMGGMVSAGVAQVHGRRFDAAVAFCGGLGGAVGQWNQKLDTLFTLKTLLPGASGLPVTGIPADVDGARQAWFDVLARAQGTPEGRARIALAAAVGQLPAWGRAADGSPTPKPGSHDTSAMQEGMYLALAGGHLPYVGQAMSSRRSIELLAGGNPSWNAGVDYARQLALAEPAQRRAVRQLYADAGLDLAAELRTLAGAPRITADPSAVSYLERGIVFDGELDLPVLTVNAVGDQISTVAQQQSYGAAVRSAGNAPMLRQTYVDTVGHCTFSTGEQVAAIESMARRLDSGLWGQLTPDALNRLARRSGGGEPARYVEYRPPIFNRPYHGEEDR